MKRMIIPLVIPLLILSCALWIGLNRQEVRVPGEETASGGELLRAASLHPLSAVAAGGEPAPETGRSYVVTQYKSEESEEFLWRCLKEYSPNDVISAAVMGYFWRESFFRSDAAVSWGEILAETGIDYAARFTAEMDAGLADGSTRESFIYQVRELIGGYGLGQWYAPVYLETLYDFAQEWGTSLGDAEMQCAFVIESLMDNEKLWGQLLLTEDPEAAGELIAIYYDGTSIGVGYIGDMAKEFYEKHHKDPDAAAEAA